MIKPPQDIQFIGNEVAILWPNGREDYFKMEELRACSPSAENMGERDILGNLHGGDGQKKFPGVEIRNWILIGNYAIRFYFSDGHNTGLFSFEYLQKLGDAKKTLSRDNDQLSRD